MTIASFIGTSLPIILESFDIDPAIASAPFISSALDIIGQVIYFYNNDHIIYEIPVTDAIVMSVKPYLDKDPNG